MKSCHRLSAYFSTIVFLSFIFAIPVRAQQIPDPGDPKQKAMQLLRKNLPATGLGQSTLNGYIVSDAYADAKSGTFLVYLQQAYLDIPVYNKIGVYVFKNEVLVSRKLDYVPRLQLKAGPRLLYSVDAARAVRFAAGHLSIPMGEDPKLIRQDEMHKKFLFTSPKVSLKNINADLVWLPMNDGAEVRLAWNVRLATPDGKGDWWVRVDAQTGSVLEKSSLIVKEKAGAVQCPDGNVGGNGVFEGTAMKGLGIFGAPAVTDASYEVYALPLESPNFGNRTLEIDPWQKAGAGNNAATLGWHFDNTTNYTYTRGNNVWALEDTAGHSQTTGFGDTSSTAIPTLTFNRALNFAVEPVVGNNIHAAIDNLFYWNNTMHDISYQYGFDEAAGNFQADNQGRGGIGNDFVDAFSESGAGVDNSDFATPPDGENPRMRMFQFNESITSNVVVSSPAVVAGSYTNVESAIGIKNQLAFTGPVSGGIVLVNDVSSPTTHQGCPISNTAALTGKIALIDRGGTGCSFVIKIKNAQNAGAVGVILVNNVAGAPIAAGGTDSTLSIPAVMISQADGATLKANLTGLTGTLSANGVLRDGALDNGVISHEYTHGISNRLTGGPANTDCLANAEQGGEGWSDYVALMVVTDWSTAAVTDGTKSRTLGTYALSEPATGAGVRIHPYSTDMGVDPWTYGDMTASGGEVHTIGEIWCSTLWDMTWNIIQAEGIDPDIYHGTKGNNIALQLVIEGMKLQPCSPGYLDARDAILKADSLLYGYVHKCAIWNAFARRGMGKSASQGSSNSTTDQTAAFDLPSGMQVAHSVSADSVVTGDNITYTIKAYCDCTPLSNISVVDTLSGNLSFVSAPGGTFTSPVVHFDALSFSANETKTFTVQARVSGSFAAPDTLINDSRDPDAYSWTMSAIQGGAQFAESTVRSHSGTHSLFAPDSPTPTDFTLTSNNLLLDTISTLSFWHFYETDATFDGGVVEISTDGGITWQDLGPDMIQNGYNETLDPSATDIGNRQAFSGSSGGAFIQTVIRLTGFAGKTAKVRFRFTSDVIIGVEGWYIDDILLHTESGVVGVASVFSGATQLARSSSFVPFKAGSNPLPVNFLLFEARKQDRSSLLHWVVNGELNVGKYIVERSGNGLDFTAIGEVAAGPAGGGEKDYYFTDNQTVDGKDYYRIEEKDINGNSTYSVIKLIDFEADADIRLSPVPTFSHTVDLETGNGSDLPVAAYLVNTVGQTLKVFSLKPGANRLTLDNFPQGLYMLRIVTGQQKTVIRKLVIQ
jgi:extracellular elastinolytic metalloproteinase